MVNISIFYKKKIHVLIHINNNYTLQPSILFVIKFELLIRTSNISSKYITFHFTFHTHKNQLEP